MTEIHYFRNFRYDDLQDLEQMVHALYQEDSYGEPMSRRKIRQTVKELLSKPEKGNVTMFCIGEKIIGYAIIIYYWSNEYGGDLAFIDELYVKPQWRRKKIGTSFIEYVSTLKSGYLKGLQVEVNPANEKALTYYRHRGFTPSMNRYLFKKL